MASTLTKIFSAVILCLFLIACNNRKIEYSLKKVAGSYPVQQLKEVVLGIEVLDDRRNEHDKNKVLFKRPIQHSKEERAWYFNVEKKYRVNVPFGMTSMLAQHLRQRGAFKSVKNNGRDSCDYYLKGELHYFYGAQLPGKAQGLWIFSVLFPPLAIPALVIGLTERSRAIVIIEIHNVEIFNRAQQLVFKTDVSRRYEHKYRSRGGAKAVFRTANDALEEYFSELVITVEREISSAQAEINKQ